MIKIFVFGTLKDGFPNFESNKGTRFRGDFVTKEALPLMLVGERFSPWLILPDTKLSEEIDKRFQTHPVKGQVFEVNQEALDEMDKLERIHDADGYRRVEIDVFCESSAEIFTVFVYGKPYEQCRELAFEESVRKVLEGEYLLEHAKLYSSRNKP